MEHDIFNYNETTEDLLFHYTNREAALENILADGRLRLSPLNKMDDPRESKKWSFVYWRKPSLKSNKSKIIQIEHILAQTMKRKSKIISFCLDNKEALSEDPEDIFARGYCRSRMWSQYADRHKGLCLIFSKEALIRQLHDQFRNQKIFYLPVNYINASSEAIQAREITESAFKDKRLEDFIYEHLEKYYKTIYFEKAEDYRDEHECRIVMLSKMDGYEFMEIQDGLKGIVVGIDFPKVYLPCVKELIKRKYNVPFAMLNWHNGNPSIKMESSL